MAFVGQTSGDSMGKPGVMFYFDVRPCIKRLSLEEKGQLFEAILDYGEFGIEPELDGAVGVAWDFLLPKLDRDDDRYSRQVEQRQYAVFVREVKKHGGTPPPMDEWRQLSGTERYRLVSADNGQHPTNNSQTTTNNSQLTKDIIMGADKPPTRKRFVPPTVQDVAEYCRGKGYAVNAERFVDYYTANGWKVGKNPMKDWKAAVRTWTAKEKPAVVPATPEHCGYVLAPLEDPYEVAMRGRGITHV